MTLLALPVTVGYVLAALATSDINIGPIVQFVAGGGLAGLIAAIIVWRRFPREADKLDAQRDEIMQDLGRKNTLAASQVVDLVNDQMEEMSAALEEMKSERSKLRDRALAAEAAEAKAKAEAAQTMAELATEKALRSEERHGNRNEISALAARIEVLERERDELRDQLAQLLAGQGIGGRRRTDPA